MPYNIKTEFVSRFYGNDHSWNATHANRFCLYVLSYLLLVENCHASLHPLFPPAGECPAGKNAG